MVTKTKTKKQETTELYETAPSVEAVKAMPTRDTLLAALLSSSSSGRSTTIILFSEDFYDIDPIHIDVREPTAAMLDEYQRLVSPKVVNDDDNKAAFGAAECTQGIATMKLLLKICYIPNTNQLIFDTTHLDLLKNMCISQFKKLDSCVDSYVSNTAVSNAIEEAEKK